MQPVLLPLVERLGRAALDRRGLASRSVRTPNGALHAYDGRGAGDLPTTVVLHGLGAAATGFGPVLTRLLPHVRRVVAPDYPGHGFSAGHASRLTPDALSETVGAAIDALVDEPAILVGNSLGGALALTYAIARPSRVAALVLLSPAGARAPEEEWDAIRRAFELASRSEALALLDRLYHRTPWFMPLFAHELPKAFARRAVRDLLETSTNDHTPDPDALAALRMPILLLWGRSERLLPSTHLAYFTRHLPEHAVIEQPEGFGHCPHVDAPGRLTRRIVAFARAHDLRSNLRRPL